MLFFDGSSFTACCTEARHHWARQNDVGANLGGPKDLISSCGLDWLAGLHGLDEPSAKVAAGNASPGSRLHI